MLAAVESELRGAIGTLQAMGDALGSDGPAEIRQDVVRLLATHASLRSVVVHDGDGRRIVSVSDGADGTEMDTAFRPQTVREVLDTRATRIGDLLTGAAPGSEPGIPILVPIVRGGRADFVVGAVMPAASFQRLFELQQLPAGWVSGLVDRRGQLIARVPAKPAGSFASEDYLRHSRAAHEGWYRGRTIEGNDTFTAFLGSTLTGWSLGYAVPAETVMWGTMRSGWLIAGGILLSMVSAAGVALWLGRRVDQPVSRLIKAAGALGAGAVPPAVESSITEVVRLSQALVTAGQTIAARDRQLRDSEDVLRRQAVELRTADENKSRFLAQLGHELRNPLSALANGVGILRRSPPDPAPSLAMMERQIGHMSHLINDLLDVSRIAQGQLVLDIRRVAVQIVVRDALEIARPALDHKGQQVRVERPSGLLFVEGDAVRLAEVLSNLVHNASKFSPTGAAIEIGVERAGGEVVLTVRDFGIGFDPDAAGRVFDLFVQLGPPDSTAAGLGIGLAVVKSLVELHGGRVGAHSEGPGQGATFTIRLPLSPQLQQVA